MTLTQSVTLPVTDELLADPDRLNVYLNGHGRQALAKAPGKLAVETVESGPEWVLKFNG